MLNVRFAVLAGMILAAAASRLIPHPPNFTAVWSVALFGGAYFTDRRAAFVVTLAAMFLSDLFIGLHGGMWVVYACFAATVCIGFWLRRARNMARVAGGVLASTILFFVVTNFAVWAAGVLYPRTWEGLVACYVAAIPFFRNSLVSTALYSVLLFGGFELLSRRFAALHEHVPGGA